MTRPAPSWLAGRVSSRTTCGWSGRSSAESSASTMRSPGPTSPSSALSSVVLPLPVPPLIRNDSRASHQRPQQPLAAGRERARRRQLAEGERAGAHHAQRQAGAADGHRRQHRVQPGPVGQPGVHPRPRVVQPSSRDGGQPLGEPPHRRGVREGDRGQLQAAAPVHPHPVRRGDQHVGDARVGQQRLQRPGADQFRAQLLGGAEHLGVAQHPALFAQGLRHARGGGLGAALGEPAPDAVEEGRAVGPVESGKRHRAPPASVSACSQKAAQNRASGPRPVRAGRSGRAPGPQQRRLDGHGADQRQPEQPGHLVARRVPARRAPVTATRRSRRTMPMADGRPGRPPPRPAAPPGRRAPHVELGEGLRDAVVQAARQVDDDRAAPPPGGGEHRAHGLGRHGHAVAPVPAEHAQRVQFRQRLLQGTAADPAARGGEVRPAQPFGALTAEQHVESAAQRIGVHQQRAQALAARR